MTIFIISLLLGLFIVTLSFLKAKQEKDLRELRSRFRDELKKEV